MVAEQSRLKPHPDIRVAGVLDEFSEVDRPLWTGCELSGYTVRGPRAFGWSQGLSSIYDEFAPDIVQIHGLWMYYSAFNERYCRLSRTPYLVAPHGMLDSWALRNSPFKKSVARKLFEDRHLRNAGCLHALCVEEAREFRKLGLRNPICVVPNGVVVPPCDLRPTSAAPWSVVVPAGTPVMLFLGRLHPKKGLDILIEAWSALCVDPVVSEWRLVIAGWGENSYVEQLKSKVRDLKLQQQIIFAGPLFGDQKAAAFANAAAFVLPSYSEGLPMAVLEAWSHRLPVLMTPECNLPVGFERGAAIRVEATVRGVAKPMRDFLRMSDKDQMSIGDRGLALVTEQFTWQKIAANLNRVYRWLIGNWEAPEDICFKQ